MKDNTATVPNWKPYDDYCIRFKDKTGKPRTEGQLSEMVGRIGYIAMEYGFSLDVWGSAKLAEEK